MIHWNIVVFAIVIILLGIWWLNDYLSEDSDNLFSSGTKYESGGEGYVAFILILVFVGVWGGIFWW